MANCLWVWQTPFCSVKSTPPFWGKERDTDQAPGPSSMFDPSRVGSVVLHHVQQPPHQVQHTLLRERIRWDGQREGESEIDTVSGEGGERTNQINTTAELIFSVSRSAVHYDLTLG
ncbi:hypothetical protein JZ751_009090 [Albula glossodonta]|uniref:Uncharacterized protein n=1 Tax=Albula glossodonta TaxID=121402 RepID=A0A8T2N3Y5_9TELE|nr:hypothetical protein JZ751_009090 [Albula glossodonta]